ncbi:MAG: sensor histidine kinase [Anaerolineae bacterium]|nr:sensor histidine kinase [Anaerolineae bacterium]
MAKRAAFCYDGRMANFKLFERIRSRAAQARRYGYAEEIEPGLLQLLRSYVIFLAVLFLFNLLGLGLVGELAFSPLVVLYLLLMAGLLVYLFSRWLREHLKAFYLAGGLFLFLLIALSQLRLGLQLTPELSLAEWTRLYFSNGFTLLFIPLLVAAWQYGLRGVAGLIVIASLGEVGVFLAAQPPQEDLYLLALILLRDLNFFLIGAVVARLMMAQRRQRHELKAANQQLAQYAATLEQLAVSRERNRLARDLHDTLAHTLSGVSVQLEAVRALWTQNPAQAHDLLDRALNDTRSGLSETRRALQDLRAEPIEDLGLLLALEQLAQAFQERSGVACDVRLPQPAGTISPALQNALYRSAQEALLNIDRHAGARRAWLSLDWRRNDEAQMLTLTIRDDGQGFDPALDDAAAGHYGLRGLRERAALLGGSCRVESQPGRGATVVVQIKETV